jgi:hypothetical protein
MNEKMLHSFTDTNQDDGEQTWGNLLKSINTSSFKLDIRY